MGRTLRAPILKLGVNCMAAISNEKVSCTDVCITAGGCCGLAIGGVWGWFLGGGRGRGGFRKSVWGVGLVVNRYAGHRPGWVRGRRGCVCGTSLGLVGG